MPRIAEHVRQTSGEMFASMPADLSASKLTLERLWNATYDAQQSIAQSEAVIYETLRLIELAK